MAVLFLDNEQYGNGGAGVVSQNSVTDSPIDSGATGTSGTKSLSATNGSFAAGQIILIIDMRTGAREINVIASYVAGTITTKYALQNNYTNAQVIVGAQHQTYEATSVTPKAWDGTVGGVFFRIANGSIVINSLAGSGKGFRGGAGATTSASQGEGTGGAGTTSRSANGNGGGGGAGDAGNQASGGGGGGHAAAGTNGQDQPNPDPGIGGNSVGSADLSTMFMGGAGGGGGRGAGVTGIGGNGGNGGCIVVLIAPRITISGASALDGNVGSNGSDEGAAGGGGAGGSGYLVGQTIVLGSNLLTALAGAGGTAGGSNRNGGAGSAGRFHIEYSDSISGTTNPTYDSTKNRALAPSIFGGIV